MARFIHLHADWPNFRWDDAAILGPLAAVRHRQGRFLGRMESLGQDLQAQAAFSALTEEAIKTSQIEGENLDRDQVRSSLARRLGLDIGGLTRSERRVDGLVDMMLDATARHAEPLDEQRLFAWQAALFPNGRSGLASIVIGAWRDDATGTMQVVSEPAGREKVHFEAPAAARLPAEMAAFITWFNARQPLDPVLKAAIAHLWFVTLHPFEDGNGRVGRALGDMLLARAEGSSRRFYSLSSQIRTERAAYYEILERTQRSDLDITAWLLWFLACLDRAIAGSDKLLAAVLTKAWFWDRWTGQDFNPRQRKTLNLMLDGLDGRLTTSRWARITGASPDTALRDISDLVARGVLAKGSAGGRSTEYVLAP